MIENTEKLLSRLGEQLELIDSPKISLVICGGSALNVTGLVKRTTKDIDVLGQLRHKKVVKEQLPESFWAAAKTVGKEFNLEEGWINDDPSPMVEGGLPEGLEERLIKKNYGTKLTVGYIGRLDQIYFKLWASADRNPDSYHVQDLKKLEPSPEEIEGAARWCLKQDPSEGFRQILVNMLQELGFEDVSRKL